MTLPDKAIEAIRNKVMECKHVSLIDAHAEFIFNAAINALWSPFDREDPNTWPKSEYAPSGVPWLVRGKLHTDSPCAGVGCFRAPLVDEKGLQGRWAFVLGYMDPIHIMPETD